MSRKQRIWIVLAFIAATMIAAAFTFYVHRNGTDDAAPQKPQMETRPETNQANSDQVPLSETERELDPGAHSDPEVSVDPEGAVDPEPEPYTTTATLTAVGDIMMHSPQLTAAYDAGTDTYSFDTYFTEVQKYIQQGNWAVANLETPLAGEDLTYSGYPEFNAPDTLADTLQDTGFNVITTANNHSLDRRETGVLRTINQLQKRGLAWTGTAASAEAASETLLIEKEEINMAFLSYTYGTNGIPIPEGKSHLVNLIDAVRIIADIRQARERGADVVTVALHFGYEYHRQPNQMQKDLAHQLIAEGADIILGSHPHVVQPYEWVTVPADGGGERTGFVIYSLGNFISNQSPSVGTAEYTDVGVILQMDIVKSHPDGTIALGNVRTIPTWVNKYTDQGKRVYRVLPMEDILIDQDDPFITQAQYKLLDRYAQEMSKHLQPPEVPVHTLPNK